MFRFVLLVSVLLTSTIGTAAFASLLQPSGQWDVDYGNTQCTAARAFHSNTGQVVLGIVPSLNGSTYRLLVSIERAGPAFAKESQGKVDFGRGAISGRVLYYGGKGVKMSVYQYRVSTTDLDQARSAAEISFSSGAGDHYTFVLSDMPAVLDELRHCSVDLRTYWSMSGTAKLSVAHGYDGDVRSLFTASDYPTEAVTESQQGSTQYQLLIDEKGAVVGCDVLASSGDPLLDARGCEVIKGRASFSPAQDVRGDAVRSVFTTPPITWPLADLSSFDCIMMHESTRRPGVSTCGELAPQPMRLPVTFPSTPPKVPTKERLN